MITDKDGVEWVPLTINEIIVGKISFDIETGKFHGSFSEDYIQILFDGLDAAIVEMIVRFLPGNPLSQEELNNRLEKYLENNNGK